MKKLIVLFLFACSLSAFAQSGSETQLLANARSLHQAIFGTRDSLVLDRLFGEKLNYAHSGGKLENRTEAIHNIVHNASSYTEQTMGPVSVWIEGKTGVTRHQMTANEIKKDGTVVPLKLHILMVWTKEKKGWKLLARQAVKMG